MKKVWNIFWICILVIIVTKCFKIVFNFEEVQTSADAEIAKTEYSEFDYGDYTTVRVLHTDTGEVEEMELDVYLYGVVAAEMPVSFEFEALKAQAVVARTYTIYKIKTGSKHLEQSADICDSSLCCQAWISKENRLVRWDKQEREENLAKIEEAVNSTIGKVILYQGEPINALFHSNSGGSTDSSINIWGGDYPYLQSVATSGEEAYSSYNSEVVVTKDELIQKMLDKYETFQIDFDSNSPIEILEMTDGREN